MIINIFLFLFVFAATIKISSSLRYSDARSYIYTPNKYINNNVMDRKFIRRLNAVDESIKNNEHIIKLTDNAKNKIKQLVTEIEDKNLILKLCVENGGCKGLKYKLNPIKKEDIEPDDYIQQFDELKFILSIDSTSVIYIYNNILDYSNDLINGGFKFINPNATKKCGCGKSFNV
ncbi:iron-sulfur assembly protein, putative [Plasmodium yoelii]|nr:iron-sulfur assembly protein, putative [Plasmodium yoelii]CDU19569.1 iron-sulfur assembly protein, putative [Plasmodium yoelii]VTZ80205.1 iron-sulfur assembly protein, putative [Plasmodium yoelii]|eukprot:XP_022812720.1 iron-sulfur assembly protein, putative [Plasmodium yoelii]